MLLVYHSPGHPPGDVLIQRSDNQQMLKFKVRLKPGHGAADANGHPLPRETEGVPAEYPDDVAEFLLGPSGNACVHQVRDGQIVPRCSHCRRSVDVSPATRHFAPRTPHRHLLERVHKVDIDKMHLCTDCATRHEGATQIWLMSAEGRKAFPEPTAPAPSEDEVAANIVPALPTPGEQAPPAPDPVVVAAWLATAEGQAWARERGLIPQVSAPEPPPAAHVADPTSFALAIPPPPAFEADE
ncbi:MAG: hypothetical protein ACYCW6_00035 [Candidatus Xenobia bacterium]